MDVIRENGAFTSDEIGFRVALTLNYSDPSVLVYVDDSQNNDTQPVKNTEDFSMRFLKMELSLTHQFI